MSIRQLPSARWTVPGTSGGIASGWYVYTYQPGTSTAKATYTDYTGNTANTNPIVLDARGEANIWFDGTYKIAVYTGDMTAGGVLVWSQDNYGEGTTSVLQGNFNLVLNGSFEQDTNGDGVPDDWTVTAYTGGTVALDTADQIHGAQSLKFTSVGTGGGFADTEFFEVEGSKTLPVSFAIKASVATVHNQVDVVWYTAAQAVISTTTLYTDSATNPLTWTDYAYAATAPATARYGKVRLYGCKDDSAQAGSAWFDNVIADASAAGLFHNVNNTVTSSDEDINLLSGQQAAGLTSQDIAILIGRSAAGLTSNDISLLIGRAAAGLTAADLVALVGANTAGATGTAATPTINKIPVANQTGGRLAWGWKPAFRGALVYSGTTQSIPDSTNTVLTFGNESYDTDSIHDTVTNTSRLTVPSGVTKVVLKGHVSLGANATGYRSLGLLKNGVITFAGRPYVIELTPTTGISCSLEVTSAVLTVSAGDYFELEVIQTSGGSLNATDTASGSVVWFAMEIIE